MSRIEKALEKAAMMRERGREPAALITPEPKRREKEHRFEGGDACIDRALIDRHIVCMTEPLSPISEQYRKLKARVLKLTATSKGNLRTIMVTSSEGGEGKTITAINLASALSNEIDYTVLLVDADLRNPSIHRYFGLEPKLGLSDYLRGGIDLGEVIVKTGIGKLVILPGGEPPENSGELLSSERMRRLVQELKQRYPDRYVIFDSSPLLVTADPLPLGGHMDGVLFVVQEGRVAQKSVRHCVSLMKGWNVLGVVFNNATGYEANSSYGYYQRYGVKRSPDGNGSKNGPQGS